MTRSVLIFAAFIIYVNAKPTIVLEDGCDCVEMPDDNYEKKLFEFIEDAEKSTDLDVIPGELSPLIPCESCPGYSRKKRKVTLEAPITLDKSPAEESVTGRKVAEVTPKEEKPAREVILNVEKPSRGVTPKEESVEEEYVRLPFGGSRRLCPRGTKLVSNWCIPDGLDY